MVNAMGLRGLLSPLALKHERSWISEGFMEGIRGLERVPPRGHPIGTTMEKHIPKSLCSVSVWFPHLQPSG